MLPLHASSLSQVPDTLSKTPPKSLLRRFLSRIPAGFPSPATDYMEEGLDLNEHLIRHKAATFVFGVKGDSMRNAGINDGDKVLVDRSVNPKSGHIVVAVVNGEYTIKRLYRTKDSVELRPENPAFATRLFIDGESLEIWGVVVGLVRRYPC